MNELTGVPAEFEVHDRDVGWSIEIWSIKLIFFIKNIRRENLERNGFLCSHQLNEDTSFLNAARPDPLRSPTSWNKIEAV